MSRWSATVVVTTVCKVTVDAESWGEARDAAEESVKQGDRATIISRTWSAKDLIQLGEPWCSSRGWFDLHGPDDVIVIERASGNAFTENDVKLLAKRIRKIGFRVLDHWNGAGSGTVSFKCSGRKGARLFTKEQLQALIAPRT